MAKKPDRVFVSAALTGAVTPKSISPYHPCTAEEIAADAVKCVKAGASMLHIHVRDAEAHGTMDLGAFEETFNAVHEALDKEHLDAIINLTTAGGPWKVVEDRIQHIRKLKPEVASYDIGSFNWDDAFLYDNRPEFLVACGKAAVENDIKLEIEVFDSGHIRSAATFINKGLMLTPPHFQFVLGVGGAMRGTIDNVVFLKNMLKEEQPEATWGATGIGISNLEVMYASLAAGCDGVRAGLEDNIYLTRGVKATNEQLIARAVNVAKLYDKKICTAEEAREVLNIHRRSW